MTAHVKEPQNASQNYTNGVNAGQLTVSRTAMAVVATLANFALLLRCIMLENEQSNTQTKYFAEYAQAQANAQQQKGADQYTGLLVAGILTICGAGFAFASQLAPNPSERQNNDEIDCLQNKKDALVGIRDSLNSPEEEVELGAVAQQGANGPQQKFVDELKDGNFIDENVTVTKNKLGIKRIKNTVTERKSDDDVSIKATIEAAQLHDRVAGTNDAAEIKAALNKRIDQLTMDINSKAQKIGGFSGLRQTLSSGISSAMQGGGNIAQANSATKVGGDEQDIAIDTAVSQQATSMVQTNQGQINNSFNLANQTLSGLGQLSANANS
jgi:hypothetical protein